ncbi:MAG: hypothetical protein HY909_09010 [Deltaproteobacteria bacterium]|nr:hypothetical protein [Deltaproteobacteria bacterium]
MAIGERFTALLEARGVKQAALAAQYREHALKRGREFAQDTIESHISRLKKGEPVAVRFFFADLTDARDLLALLAVPEEERGAYVRDANALLSPEERPLRAVVDLSDSVQGRALVGLCDELADKIVLAIPERVALVVTEAQRQYLLPRCTPEGRVQVEIVANAEQGWVRTQKLAADGAVVVSARRFDPLFRWIAFQQSGQEVELEPSDGIVRCAMGKSIDDARVDVLRRRLEVLLSDVAPSQPPQELVMTPCALRWLLAALALGLPIKVQSRGYYDRTEVNVDEKTRAAWGKALNIGAVATEEQWGGALLARAMEVGVTVAASGGEGDLASHRARVVRGGSTPRAILVGGEVHLINASAELRTKMQGLHGVRFHDEEQRLSGFKRIEELVATTPWKAWLDDPYMDAAIERIDPDRKDRDELEFARASLLLHGKLHATEAPCSREWRATLTEILRSELPPVGVRVPPRLTVDGKVVTLLPEAESVRRSSQRGVELHGVPALAPPRIVRESPLHMLKRADQAINDYLWEQGCQERRFLLPTVSTMEDFDWLYLLFDSSPARVVPSRDKVIWWSANQKRHLLGLAWEKAPLPTPARFWHEADETLAALWMALRRAARHADATTLHDGTGMLEMGGGVLALIKVAHVRAAGDGRVEADFLREPRTVQGFDGREHRSMWSDELPGARPIASILQGISTRVAVTGHYKTRIMAEVPTQVFLAKGTARVTITFKATTWETFGEHPMRPEFGAAVAGVLHAEDDARRNDDDDD